MKNRLLLASMLIASTSFAANFGAPVTTSAAAPVSGGVSAPIALAAAGPQFGQLFRIVKPDGSTVIQQGNMAANIAAAGVINVAETDAFLISNGMCAFNIRYDEISAAAAVGTTNRLYSNDRPIAINSKIDLLPGVPKSVWTQPYLVPGVNNVRIVVNADSAAPSTGWVRVNVAGKCGGKPVATVPPPPPAVTYKPGSAEWNNFNTAWGYSNYAVTQLKSKGYARYNELVNLNSLISSSINAKSVTQSAYNSLMTSWNSFVTDATFRKAITSVVAAGSGIK